MPIMNKLTAAYLAGLIDGEGYISILKNKKDTYKDGFRHQAVLKIVMTDKEIIEWLYNGFGGLFEPRKGIGNRKDSYCWVLKNNKNLIPFLLKVTPYLKVKRKQANILIEFNKTFGQYQIVKNKSGGVHKELSNQTREQRESLYHQIRELNKIGKWQPKRLSEVSLK